MARRRLVNSKQRCLKAAAGKTLAGLRSFCRAFAGVQDAPES